MIKKGRPKIYYDCIEKIRPTAEPIDLCLQYGLINLRQHRLSLHLRWLYTINFGLPTVQAYNLNKIPGRDISKYDDETLYEKRQEYNRITNYLYQTDKAAAKLFLNILIHHYKPKFLDSNFQYKMVKEIEMFKLAATTLEKAHSCKLSIFNNNNKIHSFYDYKH